MGSIIRSTDLPAPRQSVGWHGDDECWDFGSQGCSDALAAARPCPVRRSARTRSRAPRRSRGEDRVIGSHGNELRTLRTLWKQQIELRQNVLDRARHSPEKRKHRLSGYRSWPVKAYDEHRLALHLHGRWHVHGVAVDRCVVFERSPRDVEQDDSRRLIWRARYRLGSRDSRRRLGPCGACPSYSASATAKGDAPPHHRERGRAVQPR